MIRSLRVCIVLFCRTQSLVSYGALGADAVGWVCWRSIQHLPPSKRTLLLKETTRLSSLSWMNWVKLMVPIPHVRVPPAHSIQPHHFNCAHCFRSITLVRLISSQQEVPWGQSTLTITQRCPSSGERTHCKSTPPCWGSQSDGYDYDDGGMNHTDGCCSW